MKIAFETEKFKIKRGEECLNRNDFEYWPAWSEHYDYDEIDVIESWGIDRKLTLNKFAEYDNGGLHPHYTILDLRNLPFENKRIFLLAKFKHSSGKTCTGYIMNMGELCISIFTPKSEYIFSSHPDLRNDMRDYQIKAESELGVSDLFPLSFTTGFFNSNGDPIVGIFDLK